MQVIRTDLELEGIFMQCNGNGAAKNVYPSPMQRTGRTAYVLELCCPTKLSNVVDIFETREGLGQHPLRSGLSISDIRSFCSSL